MKSPLFPKSFVRRPLASTLALTLGLLLAASAGASGITEPLTDVLTEPGSVGLGFVTRTEASPYRGAGTQTDVLPLYMYEGERLFLHANQAGLKLLNSDGQRLDVFVEKRLEGFPTDPFPSSVAGMAHRHPGTDVGVSYRYRQPWGDVQAELLRGTGNASRGTEFRLGYSYDWRSGPWLLRPAISVAVRDAKLNDYYYGVLPGEATASRPAYSPGGGVNASAGLYGTYELSQRWRLLGGVSATVLDSGIKNSPIVKNGVVPTFYVGALYDFGSRSPELAKESTPTYFKLLYGRATEDGCHLIKIVTARCLSTANNNSTNVTAIQVGKPFARDFNGWPVDLVTYVGLAHHDDNGLQPNGLQVDLFMKAFYTGFPWRDRLKTRIGFGMGVSLAQRVPYIEEASQAALGERTSRLLHHLDPTVDISLGDLIGSRALKETYVGIGVSHRSGILRKSRLLGNVYGGSNYIYTYVETAL